MDLVVLGVVLVILEVVLVILVSLRVELPHKYKDLLRIFKEPYKDLLHLSKEWRARAPLAKVPAPTCGCPF